MTLVRARDVTVAHGDHVIIEQLDLEVSPGEVVALLGINGAGKTSTLETLEGYLPEAAGRIEILGVAPQAAMASGRVGVALQDGGFAPGARVREIIDLFRSLHDSAGPTTDDLLTLCGLAEVDRGTFRRLSGGEQRRLSLAVALVGHPELLLLDEPTAGVDQRGRERVIDTIRQRRDDGCGVLVTTHELDLVEQVADRVAVLHGGKLAVTAAMGDIAGMVPPRVTAVITPVPDPTRLAAALGVAVAIDGGATVIDAPGSNALTASLAVWCDENGHELGSVDTVGRLTDLLRHIERGK